MFNKFKTIFLRLFQARRPFKLTPAGWVFILYTIGVGAGAINTGNNLLYLVFGIFLGLILASGVLSDLSLWGVEIKFDFPEYVRAGTSNIVSFQLINHKKFFSSFAVTVEIEGRLNGEPIYLKAQVPFAAAGEKVHTYFSFDPRTRGWFEADHFRLTTFYPFGLLKKWWTIKNESIFPAGMFVYPAVFPLDLRDIQSFLSGQDSTPLAPERGEGAAVHGLRDFRSNDNPRRIHWKASARRSAGRDISAPFWLIREMEKDQEISFVIELPMPEDLIGWTREDKESLVAFAASLLEEGLASNLNTRLIWGVGGTSSAVRQIKTDDKHQSVRRFLSLWDPSLDLNPRLNSFLTEGAFHQEGGKLNLVSAFQDWRNREK